MAEELSDDEFVRLLLNSTGEGIFGIDLTGSCTFANPACLKLLGYESDSQLLGRNMHELVHHTRPNGEPYPQEQCRIYQAFREHKGTHVDDEVMWCANGSSFPAEYWSYPVERDGELLGCVVTFVDISQRLRVEEELRRTGELNQLLLNSAGAGIYGIDLDGNCTFANPACVRLLGFESDSDLLGRNLHKLSHHTRPNGEPYPVEECRIYQAFREHKEAHVDDELLFRADGSSFPAEYWSYPIERDGELLGCVVTFDDISERRRVEEELRQTEKMAALGKMSAGLAHELNNPAAAASRAADQLASKLEELHLATIDLCGTRIGSDEWAALTDWNRAVSARTGASLALSPLEASDREQELAAWLEASNVDEAWMIAPELVEAGVRTEDLDRIAVTVPPEALRESVAWLCKALAANELAATVSRSSRNISELVDAVKSYSHMDQAPLQVVDIHDGLEDTIRILGHKFKSGIELVRDYDTALPKVQIRGSELNQVWTNLIDNAIDAMGEKGTVTIKTYLEDGNVTVEIGDDGPGIPEDVQARIFDPFFTTKDVGEGTGLGLDVSRRIVRARCGGEIDFRSEPGQTVFWVRFPAE